MYNYVFINMEYLQRSLKRKFNFNGSHFKKTLFEHVDSAFNLIKHLLFVSSNHFAIKFYSIYKNIIE